MSFLTSRAVMIRSARPLTSRTAASRSFVVSARKLALSEESTNIPNREKEIDDHKHDSLSKQKSGNAEWKKELASNSEAAIKADREEIDANEDTIKNLQKQGEELGKSKQ